jgi:hypothetical protein
MRRLEIRPSRWPHLLLAAAALGMAALFTASLFVWEYPADEAPGVVPTVVFSLLTLVSAFLAVHWLRNVVRNAPVFTLDDEGFTYCPGGVSTGLIRWRDVVEIRDITVTVGGSGYGPEPQAAVGIVLRDPGAYLARFPAALQPLLQLRAGLSGTPLVLETASFGKRLPEVRRAMDEQLARPRG